MEKTSELANSDATENQPLQVCLMGAAGSGAYVCYFAVKQLANIILKAKAA